MLTKEQRTAILELHDKGLGTRRIAEALDVSRGAVKKVIRSQRSEPAAVDRPQKAALYRQEILELHPLCKGNLVRVHEKLLELGAELSYQALTSFCREAGIGQKPKVPAGRYHFEPGQELQHDTSPHRVEIAGRLRTAQTAVAALCHSRMQFFQCYPRYRRFECKIFLTETFGKFEGVTEVVMIDNTHVVVLRGTGASMVPAAEMEAFANHFGFVFRAHEKGDVNRSAHAERALWYFENNFLAGRTFASWEDLNQQAREWCDDNNRSYKRHLRAKPVELYARERLHLKPLPGWIPEPQLIHQRTVDVEGYVVVDTNRYSVPVDWIGREVQVRETADEIRIEMWRQPAVVHRREMEPGNKKKTLDEHRLPRGQGRKRKAPPREEKLLAKEAPELSEYVAKLKKKGRRQPILALRQLLRMVREYPREALRKAILKAAYYGLYDLDRVERMVLRLIAGEYFRFDPDPPTPEDDDD